MPYRYAKRELCTFCEYIEGRLPWAKIVDGTHAIAFMNLRQRSIGSVLVAPRRHVHSFAELGQEEARELIALTNRIGQAMIEAFKPHGLHSWCNIGEPAGQSMPHLHFQVVPRYEGVPYTFVGSAKLTTTPVAELLVLADRVAKSLKATQPEDSF